MGYLIDTCIWIDVERGTLAPADIMSVTGNDYVFLSPVTLLSFPILLPCRVNGVLPRKTGSAL